MGEEGIKPFRLFYVSNGRIPSKKAYSVQTMKMCEAFARQEKNGRPIELTLVTSNSRHRLKEDPFEYYGVEKVFRIVRIPSIELPGGSMLMHVLQQATYTLGALLYVAVTRPDHIYSRDPHTAAVLSFFFSNITYEVHTKMPTRQMRIVMSRAKNIVAISGGLKKYYMEEFGVPEEKIIVAHDAVSLDRFETVLTKEELRKKLGLPVAKKIVGHLGKITTMGKGKGVEDLIRAFPAILEKEKEALLLLAGVEDHERGLIEELWTECAIPNESIAVVGHIPQRDFAEYFLVCDVLVMAYPDLEHYRYFMSPIKLFEYMASGVPIVTTDLPVVREVVDESMVVFVKPGDTLSMAEAVSRTLAQLEAPSGRAKEAKKEVGEKYTWDNRAGKIIDFVSKNS